MHTEKTSIYQPCEDYFEEKYKLAKVEVIGLPIGARGSISNFFEYFQKKFKLTKDLRRELIISAIRGSCKILHNHLYHPIIK